MCIQFRVRYVCGHKGQHLGHEPCYHARMIEAYNKPDSKVVLKNPIEYYYKQCEEYASQRYIEKKKACGACVLLARGLKTVEETDEEEGDDTLEDLKKAYGGLEETQRYSLLE